MNRIIPLGFVIGVLLVGTIAPIVPIQNAYGATVFTFQDRVVTVSAVLSNQAQGATDMASDFNPFSGSESAELSIPLIGQISAFATQDSTLNLNLITASGSTATDFDISQLFTNSADAASTFEVEFELTTPTNYQLDGLVSIQEILIELGNFDSEATVNLFDIDNSLDIFSADAAVLPGAFANAGLLPTGNYRLSAVAGAFADVNDDPGEGRSLVNYDLTLQLTPVDSPPPTTPPVGGEFMPIETTSLILAGAQTFSWMIPLILSGIGIGLFVASRKF